ncbi:hypothetical protein M430DRAFT_22030 [Amorphotheca resinae ATCC 22711]|uniref:Uncharacterized protein n=1 Tax=Amorphotheca resinae ATCC 22711 TaxID=857342 RepID=A0A2T3AT92_AMORE|nr:hypothetical protein M430DRAFT_22030 [Amorphotheca resinae ATCC 22711]PSS10683.1 hypothetical protein M430DRAFT_22030 [Amorphotheca resinae ATCC 22711]
MRGGRQARALCSVAPFQRRLSAAPYCKRLLPQTPDPYPSTPPSDPQLPSSQLNPIAPLPPSRCSFMWYTTPLSPVRHLHSDKGPQEHPVSISLPRTLLLYSPSLILSHAGIASLVLCSLRQGSGYFWSFAPTVSLFVILACFALQHPASRLQSLSPALETTAIRNLSLPFLHTSAPPISTR